jgi:DNA invertase Pin-like site-specific DNA recombinase
MSQIQAALYARVSTLDQTCENQLAELRSYAGARGCVRQRVRRSRRLWRQGVQTGTRRSASRARRRQVDTLVGGGWIASSGACGT